MKKTLILCILLCSLTRLNAQNGYHEHDGFYLSMSLGPVFGPIHDDVTGAGAPFAAEYNGTGGQFDLKLGGALNKNLILHGTFINDYLTGPVQTITQMGNVLETKHSDNFSIGETMLGAGVTYYALPSNVFFSSSLGLGFFSIESTEDEEVSYSTRNGLAMQLKFGKEWWISKNWGFGVGFTYQKTNVTDTPNNSIEERLNSNRFGILFNTTFN